MAKGHEGYLRIQNNSKGDDDLVIATRGKVKQISIYCYVLNSYYLS